MVYMGDRAGRAQPKRSAKAQAMKISIDVDCTPDEARRFLGLPDVGPMQEALTAELEKRMRAALDAMGPEALMKTWLPLAPESLENVQKMFWSQLNKAMGGGPTKGGKADREAAGRPADQGGGAAS